MTGSKSCSAVIQIDGRLYICDGAPHRTSRAESKRSRMHGTYIETIVAVVEGNQTTVRKRHQWSDKIPIPRSVPLTMIKVPWRCTACGGLRMAWEKDCPCSKPRPKRRSE